MVQSRNLKAQRAYQIMNVDFSDATGSSQQNHAQRQDIISQSSSLPSHELSDLDAQESLTDEDIALTAEGPFIRSLSKRNGSSSAHDDSMAISPPQQRSTAKIIQGPPRYQPSTTASMEATSFTKPNHDNANVDNNTMDDTRVVDNFSLSLRDTSGAKSTIDMTLTSSVTGSNPFSSSTTTQTQPATMSSELEALDYLTIQPEEFNLLGSSPDQGGQLQNYSGNNPDTVVSPFAGDSVVSAEMNSMYNPSATYQHLHTTLYNHMVETARNTNLTRPGSPGEGDYSAPQEPLTSGANINDITTPTGEAGLRLRGLKNCKLTPRRQLELWRNYLDEVAVWLDMFDRDRHFQLKIPLLAKSADHLHYSVLALSARQMERMNPDKPYTESLGLYQEAIQLIVKELETMDTAVIASCVLLCVLEMMSSSPRAWGRHLSGCAMLLQAAGVNGVVGGVRQSLFWCFARMDVWGGYLQDTLTKIPTNRWFLPSGYMIDAVNHFKASCGSDSYANYAIFLSANVINVLSDTASPDAKRAEGDSGSSNTYPARWKALFNLLEDWYTNRPEEMQPLMAYPSSALEPEEPFPVVLYGSSPAINGNQIYHAAMILMLQSKPKELRLSKSPKSILWHARQICGTAVSNCHHGAWINSLQPLWIAGKIMSHETEHRAILELLARVERETGWATAWRASDLKDYWGDAHS